MVISSNMHDTDTDMTVPVAALLQLSVSHSQATTRIGEVILPNGDMYSGSLSAGNIPEGSGRYIWSDGCCVYEGEWKRGMRHGHGRTLWPSGGIYEGEYSAGYMDGQGTYLGPNNLSYKGCWKLNRKQGHGVQTYPNGDMFEGSWVQGEMKGHGKYTWANGNTYVGSMRNGVMSGKGILTWNTTGDSFEGNWLDGMMHGYGVYTWHDTGFYVGTWTRGFKDGKGTFYPKCCRVPAAHQLYIDDLRNRGVLPHLTTASSFHMAATTQESAAAPSRRNLSFDWPRSKNASLERRWSLGVAIEKLIGHELSATSETQSCENMADSKFPILEREYTQGVLISEVVLNKDSSKNAKRHQRKDIKKPGETIIKGHRSYDLMLSLQLGIRYTVGRTSLPNNLKLAS